MERYAQSETYYPTYQEGFASNATGVDASILRCADGFWWDFVAGAFQDAYDANSLSAMTEDANGTNGLWNIEAGWAIPDANAHYQVRFKVTDPTGAFYKEGPKIVVNSALLDVLADWVNGGRLDLLLDDIPTVAEFEARTIVSANYVVVGDTIAGVTLVTTTTTNSDLVTAAAIKTAMEADGGDLSSLMEALVNKLLITEASGNAEIFNDAGVGQGTVAAAFTSVAGVTQRKRMVI